ncbi:kinesin motor protein cin8 [Dinochytrium kinnereticum]|nr:kinesin motor protein cin8 [Dinochytrium kinnereticum]
MDKDSKETNINVVVRVRPRNSKEIRENSHVVVTSAKNQIQVKSNAGDHTSKIYSFDKTFGPESDQAGVFQEVVSPILDETGTGKTYTMEGDLESNTSPDAGIIPRSLKKIFQSLEGEDSEYSVKISYVEIYNEELKDLLAADDSVAKLTIFEDYNRKGTNNIKNLEEVSVANITDVLQALQKGSNKRRVASTKMNETSSRSHSIFTVTLHIKEATADGEDLLKVGKLNLVDLAGSENIGRSGAENRRAKEAGMINQSLLTLGRVINALVDKSPHIPYRESKLTRLLQDSLVSPAKCNFEETLSTLEYAHRAKNIRNKPEINQKMTKKALIKEYEVQIERLKADLQSYNLLVNESESRKSQVEETAKAIQKKEEQLLSLQNDFEAHMALLESTKRKLEHAHTEIRKQSESLEDAMDVIEKTNKNLEEQKILTSAHFETEATLQSLASGLVSTLSETVRDVDGLMDKIDRKSAIEQENLAIFHDFQSLLLQELHEIQTVASEATAKQEKVSQEISSAISAFTSTQQSSATRFLADSDGALGNLTSRIISIRESGVSDKEVLQRGLDSLLSSIGELQTRFTEQKKADSENRQSVFDALFASFKSCLSEVMKNLMENQLERQAASFKSLADSLLTEVNELKSENKRLQALSEERAIKREARRNDLMKSLANAVASFVDTEVEEDNSLATSLQATMDNRSNNILFSTIYSLLVFSLSLTQTSRLQKVKDLTDGSLHQMHASFSEAMCTLTDDAMKIDNSGQIIAKMNDMTTEKILQETSAANDALAKAEEAEALLKRSADAMSQSSEKTSGIVKRIGDHIKCKHLAHDRPTGKTPRRRKISVPKNIVRTRPHNELLDEFRSVGHVKSFSLFAEAGDFAEKENSIEGNKENNRQIQQDAAPAMNNGSKLPRSRLLPPSKRAESPFMERMEQ